MLSDPVYVVAPIGVIMFAPLVRRRQRFIVESDAAVQELVPSQFPRPINRWQHPRGS